MAWRSGWVQMAHLREWRSRAEGSGFIGLSFAAAFPVVIVAVYGAGWFADVWIDFLPGGAWLPTVIFGGSRRGPYLESGLIAI